jgi:hypothetical protein
VIAIERSKIGREIRLQKIFANKTYIVRGV